MVKPKNKIEVRLKTCPVCGATHSGSLLDHCYGCSEKRDYFAAAALTGMVSAASELAKSALMLESACAKWAPDITATAYKIADAMLKAREDK